MTIAVAADHAGFPLKAQVIEAVRKTGADPIDLGTNSTEAVDYPDYAGAAGRAVVEGRADRAIVVCGSGAGACIAANKVRGIRAATCHDTFSAHQSVEDDDVNVLCLGSRIIGPALAIEVVRAFLNARFSGAERHVRRIGKIAQLEADFCAPALP
ncbi:MAG: ribose 5-phosphate isomerase B [Bryobacteraceae bacterium]